MSGGEQRMVAIGRGLMGRPELMVIDELSLGLAPVIVDEIIARLPDIAAPGTAVLLVEQDVDAALSVAERAYVLETGHIVLSGRTAELWWTSGFRRAIWGCHEGARTDPGRLTTELAALGGGRRRPPRPRAAAVRAAPYACPHLRGGRAVPRSPESPDWSSQ